MKSDMLRQTISLLNSGNYKNVPYVEPWIHMLYCSTLFDLGFAVEFRYPQIQKPISWFQAFHFEKT